MVASLLVVAILAGAGAGYLVGNANERTVNSTSTLSVVSTSTAFSTTTTTVTTTEGSCFSLNSASGAQSLPVGFHVTVSYAGEWSISIATFSSKPINESAFWLACYSEGSGTATFYVGLANYVGGWNTVVATARAFGSNGTLTVSANIGNATNSSSTTQSSNIAVTTMSFREPT